MRTTLTQASLYGRRPTCPKPHSWEAARFSSVTRTHSCGALLWPEDHLDAGLSLWGKVVGPTVTTREVGLSAVESWFSRDAEEGLRRGLGGRPQYGSVR